MICHSHTPSHLSLDLINVLNQSISRSLIVLAVAVSIRQLVIFCNLLVGLNLFDLFFYQYSTHDIFVSFTESRITSLYPRVFGICLHLIDFVDIIFFLWIFFFNPASQASLLFTYVYFGFCLRLTDFISISFLRYFFFKCIFFS